MINRLASIDRLTLATVAIVLLACILTWSMAPRPIAPATAQTATQTFVLPALPRQEYAKWASTLLRKNPWQSAEATATNPDQAQPPPDAWHIVGIVIQGQDRFALIAQGEDPSRKYRIGDTLPDGARITGIADDRLQVTNQQKTHTHNIYRH